MHLFDALQQIIDLPDTFRRKDETFLLVMEAYAAALTLSTQSSAAVMEETSYQSTTEGWIDVWADLAGILRRSGEGNNPFRDRVQNMLLAPRDSAVAIEMWLKTVENVSGSVSEKLPDWGYSVFLPATLTPAQVQLIVKDLAYVRPAGMPFNAVVREGGTYLNTVNYSASRTQVPWEGGTVTGAYFASSVDVSVEDIPASTNNQLSALPDLLLTDPTLNPPA